MLKNSPQLKQTTRLAMKMNKNLQVNENIHKKLKEVSDKRKAEGHHTASMLAIIGAHVLALHKKEIGK